MPYRADKPNLPPTADQLRSRIPGWGADLDHADRPAWPRELSGPAAGVHWDYPDEQQPRENREKSIEHPQIPPVFGTAQPLHGVSGKIRRYAYDRLSEGRTAHWLLLILGDRVETVGTRLTSLATRHPDNLITETGVLAEARHHPIRSRHNRSDIRHQWLDPIIIAGPAILTIAAAVALTRRALRR